MTCLRRCAGGQIEVVRPPDETTCGVPFTVCCDCEEGADLFRRRTLAAEAPGSRLRPPASVRSYEHGAWILSPGPADLRPIREQREWPRAPRPDVAAMARDLAPMPDETPPPPDQRLGWRADGDDPAEPW